MLRQVKQIAIAVFAMAAIAAPASAVTVIDFATGLAGVGGQIYLDGSTVIGENIPIGNATVSGAPTGNGDYAVYGSATSSNNLRTFGSLDFNTGTGAISITGCIPGLVGSIDASGTCVSEELLLTGQIDQFFNIGNNNNFVAVVGVDTKNGQLLEAIGIEGNMPWQLTGSVQTGAPFGQGIGNSRPSVSTDIANTAVPEPATMMLLGTGLLAAFRARRKQQEQQL